MTTINQGWERYRKVFPAGTDPRTIEAHKRSFYAGAAVMWVEIVRTQGYESEEGVRFALEKLRSECEEFAESIARGG